jgi:hypothetical protein
MNESDLAARIRKLKESLLIDIENEDEYIVDAEKYIRSHVPEKAIHHFLPPNMVFLRNEYYSIFLNRLISKYHEIESYRNLIANESKNPNPMWFRELEKGEALGF